MRIFWSAALLFSTLLAVRADNPHWIWHDNNGKAIQPNDVRYFRKTFEVKGKVGKVTLNAAADDEAVVYVNGKQVASPKGYGTPTTKDITDEIKSGENVIAIRGHNVAADAAGVIALVEIKQGKKSVDYVVTDDSWRATDTEQNGWTKAGFDDSKWSKAKDEGKHGVKPWGTVLKFAQATPAENLEVLPGFDVKLIHSAEINEGSWICMTVDPRGRLIISPQADDQPLLRVTLTRDGQVKKIEKIPAPVHQAMGLLYAYNSLYVNGHGPKGTGLYRLIDSNHNDRFEASEVHFLKTIGGEGEHGYHGLALGPDKKIYMMNGNHTKVPKGLTETSPHKNYQEDFLLARQWDANGHAVGILAPGGYVLRTDKDGKKWDLDLAGFRNAYDLAFNTDGELFTFDSDMEWDWGLPWYRPIRVNHCVPGAEFGWRSGSAVWPEYYPDSLPAAENLGVGCPTGVKFGTGAKFPMEYQKAYYVLDWSYGRLFCVHLSPNGSSYTGESEVLVKGKPLNLSDLEIGKDGALYFITGGRGTQSGLYRVSYTQKIPREKSRPTEEEKAGAAARKIRHKLEAFYGHEDPKAIKTAWPYLGSEDRFLGYAARIALEWQPVSQWKQLALNETNTDAGLTALLGLARSAPKEDQRDLLMALKKFPMDSLSLTQKLDKLRVIELSFIRQGKPDDDLAKLAINKLDHLYPSDNEYLNRELSQVLIYLEAPGVIGKTLALLDQAKTQEEQVHYIFYLRNLKTGWTIAERKHYLDWFRFAQEAGKGEVTYPQGSPYLVWADQKKAAQRHPASLLHWFTEAGRDYGDGVSYPKYLVNIKKDAVATLSDDERIALSPWIEDYNAMAAFKPSKERDFVQEWKMSDLEPSLDEVAHNRNFSAGKAAFNDAQCTLCHRFGNEGGSVGPELTSAGSKYSRRDILESILEPSKVISEQYQNYTVVKTDGDIETGKIVDEKDDTISVQPSPLSPDRVEIKKSEIAERRAATLSPMPEGLLNQFTKDEILDLLAYIETAGKEKSLNFKRTEAAKKN